MNELLGANGEPMGAWENLFWIFIGTVFAGVAGIFPLFYVTGKRSCSGADNVVKRLFGVPGNDLHVAQRKGLISDDAATALNQLVHGKGMPLLKQIVSEGGDLEGNCNLDVVLTKDKHDFQMVLATNGSRVWWIDKR